MVEQIAETSSTCQIEETPPKRIGRSKSDLLHKLLSRRNGATVAQLQKQLGWQPHTVRAAISRLRSSGASIELDRSGKVARYRVIDGAGQ
jgi:DNA-binding transcriptional regulator PaaX